VVRKIVWGEGDKECLDEEEGKGNIFVCEEINGSFYCEGGGQELTVPEEVDHVTCAICRSP
jgi:hypothetical protein